MMRGLLVTSVVVVVCAGSVVPAAAEHTPGDEAVSTVFFGDSYTANFGIAPFHEEIEELLCFRARENYPAVVVRQLAEQGSALDVASDRSCGGALIEHFWTGQPLPPTNLTRPPQQEALGTDTELVVGSIGGNTLGFSSILKQCSQKLRDEGQLLPGAPFDGAEPAARCAVYFSQGDGKELLDKLFEKADGELAELFNQIGRLSPEAKAVLVGYPRIVPADIAKCQVPAPGQTEKPLADIQIDALLVFDKVQERLNDLMRTKAAEGNAAFVDLYAVTGDHTACDGDDRGIGGLFELSQVKLGEQNLPWYLHPNTHGRDLQAQHVTAALQGALRR
ncbi:SGNH/GDSL hydrolase family protein [Actinosynnema sp. CS-041913]|uniref:SGNH/GDSL hydrolase family protein n=1 Tax=Actinosynnema sp. CS-041913 TaxID=3239917 RepID=UPI003D8C845B